MRILVLSSALLVALLSGIAAGDELLIKDGEVLKGKVTGGAGGKLEFESDKVGKVSVEWSNLETFSTDEPIHLVLKDGTELHQKIEKSESGKIQVAEPTSGKVLEFPIENIDKINPPKVKWEGAISAGLAISRGNSNTSDYYLSADASRRSEVDRILLEAGYIGKRQKDNETNDWSTSERNGHGGIQYDYFFAERWFGYAKVSGDADDMANLNLRMLYGLGAGCQVFDEADLSLMAEAGLSYVTKDFADNTLDDDISYLSGRLAYKLSKNFSDYVRLLHNLDWYPGFKSDAGNYVTTDLALRSTLMGSLFAEFKVLYSFDSKPATDAKKSDVNYLFSLGWTF